MGKNKALAHHASTLGVTGPGSRGGGDVVRQASATDDVLRRREGEGSWQGMVSDGLVGMHHVVSYHASRSERLSELARHAGGRVQAKQTRAAIPKWQMCRNGHLICALLFCVWLQV